MLISIRSQIIVTRCLIMPLVLLVIADLLVAVGISQPLAIRLRLPPSVLLAAVGVAIGALPVVLGRLGLSGPGTLLISSPFS